MPVVFDSSVANGALIGGATTSGNVAGTHNVSTIAREDMVALAGVLWTGGVNVSASTFTVSFGGTAMTQISTQLADTNQMRMLWFYLADPPTGTRTVTASFSGVGTEVTTRQIFLVSATYSGVDITSAPSVTQNSGASTTSNTVSVTSVLPAHRVVSLHGVGKLRAFTTSGYNQQKRASQIMLGGGHIILGDAPGDTSVTCTATHNASSANWLAAGLSLTPSIVDAQSSLSVPAYVVSAGGGTYRQATPAPDRTWIIPADPPLY
jgi:hypothetical protein